MRRSTPSLALLLAGGILIGVCASYSDADETKTRGNNAEAQRWIEQLGSMRFRDREQAMQELSKLGQSALPNLKEAAESSDAEVRRRAQQLVERLSPSARPTVPAPQRISPKSYL